MRMSRLHYIDGDPSNRDPHNWQLVSSIPAQWRICHGQNPDANGGYWNWNGELWVPPSGKITDYVRMMNAPLEQIRAAERRRKIRRDRAERLAIKEFGHALLSRIRGY
jgi:hypothetical protein